MRLFVFFLALSSLIACAPNLVPFSENIQKEYNLQEAELKKIQFYTSSDIVLYRDFGQNQASITSGRLKVVNGREVEEIIIRRGTPGVVVFMPKTNRLGISFQSGADDKYLMFGPNEKLSNQYVLLASEWDRSTGKVTYGSETYYTTSESAYARIMIDLKKAQKNIRKSQVASGRKL